MSYFGIPLRNGIAVGLNSVASLVSGYAEPIVLSSLNLDLTTGPLDPRVTFTRASSATYFASSGVLQTAAVDVPRFDYDPSTLQPKGLLIEESRTNLLLQSRDMTQAAWSKTDVTAARTQVGIDGTANSACLMTEGSAGTAKAQQSVTVSAGSTVTASSVFKRGNTDWLRLRIWDGANGCDQWVNVNTGAKGATTAIGTSTNNSGTVTALGGGWYRVSVTSTPSGGYTVPFNDFSSASADNSLTRVSGATYIVDATQLEVGASATSIIFTTTATVTRAADNALMTSLSWFSGTGIGTYLGEFSFPNAPTGNTAIIGTSIKPTLAIGSSYVKGSFPGVVDVVSKSLTVTANVVHKAAFAFNTGDYAITIDGITPSTSTNAQAVSVPTSLTLGNEAVYLNGHIRSITYWPKRLSNTKLKAITS